ncbi:MAG: penicillin-binding protein 2 [Hellea sp.]|nr:penicillin-binding protein 2 [Hellea sp.]
MIKLNNGASFEKNSTMFLEDDFKPIAEARVRIKFGVALFVFVLLLVIIRLGFVSLSGKTQSPNFRSSPVENFRADIHDRNSQVLATTLKTYSLYVEPKKIWNSSETIQKISSVRPLLDVNVLSKRINSPKSFVRIERGLNPKERQAIFSLGLPGVTFREELKRVYPRRNLASHIVGHTDPDLIGTAGSERAFNKELSSGEFEAINLSVDLRVQYAVYDELRNGMLKHRSLSNAGIVLNIKTGEILSMVSLPNYDPNNPGVSDPRGEFNNATMSTYDLGSVFKPLTMAMALEDEVSSLTETYPVHKPFRVRNKFIRDDHPSEIPLAMPEILAESSNRGTAMLALRVGGDQQKKYLQELGLFDRAPIELFESTNPQLQSKWIDLTTVTVSYGHGISVTPLALASAIGATLNDGLYISPTILKYSLNSKLETRRVFSSETSKSVKDMMRYVVTHGTGKNANVPGYGVLGKTGTAEKPTKGGYDQDRLVTSFVGAFPYDDPTYLVMVTYDEPQSGPETYGFKGAGWNAAPTTGAIIERIAPMLGVPREVSPLVKSPFGLELSP